MDMMDVGRPGGHMDEKMAVMGDWEDMGPAERDVWVSGLGKGGLERDAAGAEMDAWRRGADTTGGEALEMDVVDRMMHGGADMKDGDDDEGDVHVPGVEGSPDETKRVWCGGLCAVATVEERVWMSTWRQHEAAALVHLWSVETHSSAGRRKENALGREWNVGGRERWEAVGCGMTKSGTGYDEVGSLEHGRVVEEVEDEHEMGEVEWDDQGRMRHEWSE